MADTRKTVLITGCNPGGIGNSLAREFHAHNLRVLATARQRDKISDLASLGIETFSLEVTDESSIVNLLDEVRSATNGRLDYLVNNAGRNYTVPALDVEFDEVRATFEVNVFAVMRMCKVFAPLLIEAKGTVVQIGSLAGVMPYVRVTCRAMLCCVMPCHVLLCNAVLYYTAPCLSLLDSKLTPSLPLSRSSVQHTTPPKPPSTPTAPLSASSSPPSTFASSSS